ncbi:MAG TPA: pitrilysin family protein [Planctomycetota bacterium]|nr:pitrilysin family protein [Planctomycetota bacterium]HRR80121.1 pitrilysin family protein [Planctomycetota bacterium]
MALENHSSETVVLTGMLVGGAVLDPAGREGLASLTAAVAQRGTVSRSYDQIYDQLDSLGASLSMGAGDYVVSFHAKCLGRHWPAVAELVADLLRRPSFPPEELQRARGEILTRLREFDQSTRMVAARELAHLVYPEGHPLRHPAHGYRATVEAMTREDLAACHRLLFRPDALIVSLVGDLEASAALDRVSEMLGDWSAPGEPLPTPGLAAHHPPEAQRAVFALADKSQADIALGFKGIPRRHPDFYALDQATEIVGGLGLMGRLGDNVRDRQGLAYYAFARMAEGLGEDLWSVSAGVNPANVERAVTSILDEIRRLQDEPVAEEELADCQNYLVGVLPLHLETNDGLASTLNDVELFGLGEDYIERYPNLVRAVTREAVQRAAQAHLTAERYSLAIAGPPGP